MGSKYLMQILIGRRIDKFTVHSFRNRVPNSTHAKAKLEGDGIDLIELLPETTLAKSKREAREFLSGGAVAINGEKAAPERRLRTSDLLHGRTILLRRGKKHWHATRWE